MQSVREIQWVEPCLDSKRIAWRYYKRSAWKYGKTNRYRAKCNFCDKSFDGKVQRMEAHLLTDCEKVAPSAKFALIKEYSSKVSMEESDEDEKHISVASSSESTSHYQGVKRKMQDNSTEPMVISDEQRHNLTLTLVKSFISGNIPFTFIEDYYFQEFIDGVSRPWKLPTISAIMDSYYVQLYEWAISKRDKNLSHLDLCTLILNKWSNTSNNSAYVFVAVFGRDHSEILDIVDLGNKSHTAESILGETEEVINGSVVPINKVKCVVTDGSTILVKFRKKLCAKYPHTIGLSCALHISNVLIKDICRHSEALEVIRNNCKIVSYFVASQIWNAESKLWMKNNNITHSLETLCENRWHWMNTVCRGVHIFQSFFEYAIQKVDDNFPEVPKEIEVCIVRSHFEKNSNLLEILAPVADIIDIFETRKTNLADIIMQYVTLYQKYKLMKESENYNNLIDHALTHLSRRFNLYFTEPIYFITLFLCPKYKKFSISKTFSLRYMKKEILTLAKLWGSNKDKCIRLNQDITNYHNDDQAGSLELQPIMFWNSTAKYSELRSFANCAFKLKGHSAFLEAVVPGFTYAETGSRNFVNVKNFKMFHIIRAQLQKSIPEHRAKTKIPITSTVASTLSNNFLVLPVGQNRVCEGAQNMMHIPLPERLDFVLLDDDDYRSYKNGTYDCLHMNHLFNYSLLEPVTSDCQNLQTNEIDTCMNFSIEEILEL